MYKLGHKHACLDQSLFSTTKMLIDQLQLSQNNHQTIVRTQSVSSSKKKQRLSLFYAVPVQKMAARGHANGWQY